MSTSHHPPRACFRILAFDIPSLTVVGTFTEERKSLPHAEVWSFTTANAAAFTAFLADQTGVFFNASVRDNPDWSATRLS